MDLIISSVVFLLDEYSQGQTRHNRQPSKTYGQIIRKALTKHGEKLEELNVSIIYT